MAFKGQGGAVNDLVLIDNVNENKIVDCLRNHHQHSEIYSYIGPVLISVNPYKTISGLYGKNVIKKYVSKKEYENKPHVYAVAERAYRNMVDNLSNECVVITGESGSGKTENAKKVMEYVAAMSSKSKEVQKVKNQLLESNPLLESFGNAKTVRNDNSSRFGKYMEILFLVGDPAGGRITTYLLEKNRVTGQLQGERNFHIFYQVLSDSAESRRLGLQSVSDYRYLSDVNSANVKTINDSGDFADTCNAMEYVGISREEQDQVFDIIAFILKLGNVEIRGGRNNSQIGNEFILRDAADSLSVNPEQLKAAITQRTVRGIKTPLSREQAQFARDSMAKSMYNKLFDWIVVKANTAIKTDKFSTSIGVLDIYGFEILGVNGFEQLCINYTNEVLHQLFIELTLKAEQEEYRKEGIPWENIDYYNNKPICDLIDQKKNGIFGLMDDIALLNGSDAQLFGKMKSNLRQKEFKKPDRGPASQFMIKHYAGEVTYDVTGFIEANKETLFQDIVQLANSSRNSVAAALFQNHELAGNQLVKKRSKTICTQYKEDIARLMTDLAKCNQHYIRCIKPNNSKRAGAFEDDLVTQQVQYLGMLEGVIVRRAGYAFRMNFDKFTAKYKCVMQNMGSFDSDSYRMTEKILQSAGVKGYKMGKSKVFIKQAESLFSLEGKRNEFWNDARAMLPEEEEGLIYADKVIGLSILPEDKENKKIKDKQYTRGPLTFCVGGRGFYWFNEDGTPAQFFPMDDIEYIGYNKREGWMTVHSSYTGIYEDDPRVNLTYLSENMYGQEVENFILVSHTMGYEIDAKQTGSYPSDAYDPAEYKENVERIGEGVKPQISKNEAFKKAVQEKVKCCTIM